MNTIKDQHQPGLDRSGSDGGRDEERSLAPAVTRAMAIMSLLADSAGPMGLSAIARELDLPKSSVANLCGTLVDGGLLRSTDSGFALGQRLAQLGAAYLASVDQVALFQECCQLFDAGANETAQLAMLTDRSEVIYLARREGIHPVRLASTPGRTLPASCTATGKAMLATLDPREVLERLERDGPLPAMTSRSITSMDALHAELERIRERGYSLDDEEVVEGVVCIAAAIPRSGVSDPLLAVSVTLLKPRVTPDLIARLADELHDVTSAIGRGLGVDPSPVRSTR
jgi:IclR family transcriptional regulator, blcABC operon repressor